MPGQGCNMPDVGGCRGRDDDRCHGRQDMATINPTLLQMQIFRSGLPYPVSMPDCVCAYSKSEREQSAGNRAVRRSKQPQALQQLPLSYLLPEAPAVVAELRGLVPE